MDLQNQLLKMKYQAKSIYNNAIKKPVEDMCLIELGNELSLNLKTVNKSGVIDQRTDSVIRALFSRKYIEKNICVDLFLQIVKEIQPEEKKYEFIEQYSSILDDGVIDYLRKNNIHFSHSTELRNYVTAIIESECLRCCDIEDLLNDYGIDQDKLMNKLTPEQQVEALLKRARVDSDEYIKKLPREYRLLYISKNYYSIFSDELEAIDDFTQDDVLQFCRKTGNYNLFESHIKAVREYIENISYEKVLEELEYIKDDESQKEYLFNTLFSGTKIKKGLTLEQYEMLANNPKIHKKETIFYNIFMNKDDTEIVDYLKKLPEQEQKDAINAIKTAIRFDKKIKDESLREIFDNIKDANEKIEYLIDLYRDSESLEKSIIKKEELIDALKQNGNYYVSDDLFRELSNDELNDIFFESKNEKVKNEIVKSSLDTIFYQKDKEVDKSEEENIWGKRKKVTNINIINKENYADIISQVDDHTAFQMIVQLDFIDLNNKEILKKLLKNKDVYSIVNSLKERGMSLELNTLTDFLKESKIQDIRALEGLINECLKISIGENKESLINCLLNVSKIDNAKINEIVTMQILHNLYDKKKISFYDNDIQNVMKNKEISVPVKNIVFSQVLLNEYSQLEILSKDKIYKELQTGFFNMKSLFSPNEEPEKKSLNQVLDEANEIIKRKKEDFPENLRDELDVIIQMNSINEKSEALSNLTKKRASLAYERLLKEVDEYSKISGFDYSSIFKELSNDVFGKYNSSVVSDVYNYARIISFISNEASYNKFVELYNKNHNVVYTINREFLLSNVLEKIDGKIIDYLSAYSFSADGIAKITDNENCLKLLSRCCELLKSNEEFPEEKISNTIKFIGNHTKFINKDVFTDEDCFEIIHIANLDEKKYFSDNENIFDYEKNIREKCDKKITSSLLTRVSALDTFGQRFFGMSYSDLSKFAYRYAQDVEKFIDEYSEKKNLSEEEQNELLALKIAENIKQIVSIKDVGIIKELYSEFAQMPEYSKINFQERMILDENIRRVYAKDYKKTLYIPDEKDKRIVDGVKVYAPMEFGMMIHSVGAYSGFNILDENKTAKEMWNSNEDTSSHLICTSYIRENNMGDAGAKEKEGLFKKILKKSGKNKKEESRIVLGFYNFSDNAVLMAGSNDLATVTNSVESQKSYRDFSFKSAEKLSEDTRWRYNEVNIKRKKMDSLNETLQPDYVVCYDAVTEKNIKVATDFDIPIVFIDREKIAQKESEKLNNMFEKFSENPDPKLIRKIINQYEGNWVSFNFSRHDLFKKYFNPNKFNKNLLGLINQIQKCGKNGDNEIFKECLDELMVSLYDESEKFKETLNDFELYSRKNLNISKINKAISKVISSTDYIPSVETLSERKIRFNKKYEVKNVDIYKMKEMKKADKVHEKISQKFKEREK